MAIERLSHTIKNALLARRTVPIGQPAAGESLILPQEDESLERRLSLLAEDNPMAQLRWGIVHRPNFDERSELGHAGLLINFIESDVIGHLDEDERIKTFERERVYAHAYDGLVTHTYPQGYFKISDVPPLSFIKVLSDRLAALPAPIRDQLNPNILESASQSFADLPEVVGNIKFPHRHHRFVELSPYSALDVAFAGDWEYNKDMTNVPIDRYRIDMIMRDPGEKIALTLSARYRAERIKRTSEGLEPVNLKRWVTNEDPRVESNEFVLGRLRSKDRDEVAVVTNRLLEYGYTARTLEDGSVLFIFGDDYSIQFRERKGEDSESNKKTGYEPVVILSEGYQATRSEEREVLVSTSVQEFVERRINSATKDKPFSFNLDEWELRRDIWHLAAGLHIDENEMSLMVEAKFVSMQPPELQPIVVDGHHIFHGDSLIIYDEKTDYIWQGTLQDDENDVPKGYKVSVWGARKLRNN